MDSPKIIIPSIGVEETINNVSLNQGILNDPGDSVPTKNPVVLYGHRTLQGSPFLRLNEISKGDTLLLEWPGIGELKYNVLDNIIVPADSELDVHGKNNLYLITCDPIGSTENRMIVQGELIEKNPINDTVLLNNPQESNAIIISLLFLIIGGILSYFELIYNKIIFLNGGL